MLTLPIQAGCLAFLLPVTWLAETGTTYTLQQSNDLAEWESVPAVIQGSGGPERISLAFDGPVGFARLRFSDDGDTNENNLPDDWEWTQFGALDVDPSADPDGDGLSNLEEWRLQSPPLDFYNGEVPVLRITCGSEWLVPAGSVSTQAVSLSLTHASGEPWPGAPVTLRLPPESAGVLVREGDIRTIELAVRTDSLGRIHPSTDSIQYQAPATGNQSDMLAISAGLAEATLLIRTSLSLVGGPPREFTWEALPDGSNAFEWSGDAGEADALIIEEQTETGEWIELVRLESPALPEADPSTNRYAIILE